MQSRNRSPIDPVTIQCEVSEFFATWLSEAGGSLAVTTYQAGKLVLIGWNGQQVSVLPRQFDKPMGLAVSNDRLALACRHEIWLFANTPQLAYEYIEEAHGRYDALYLPRATYWTGELHIHDLAFGRERLWFVNTRFSCLATVSESFNFEPLWQPKFVSEVVPEDRCHLNGLAMRDGRPAFVTAHGETDEPGGWRANKADGGVVIDVESGETIIRGLSMPHSPRWHQDRLWFLNSGTGELCVADPPFEEYTSVCALPGYLRGLCFAGDYALVGLSTIREKHIFGGLPVQGRFSKLLCGIALVDLQSGRQEGLFEFTAGCTELYDVQFLPDVFRPTILNLQKEAVYQAVTLPDSAYWLRPSAQVPAPLANETAPEQGSNPPDPGADAGYA